jgi:preprotein translocase SecE subunit
MAVAVKTSPEAPPRNPVQQLALHSLVGALFLLFSLGLVLGQLPILWEWVEESLGLNRFLSEALLLIVTGGVIVGLFFLGRFLEGPHPQAGLRAGSVLGAVALFVVLLLSLWIGNWQVSRGEAAVGMVLSVLLGGALAFGLGWLYLRPAFARWLVRLEAQGWFQLSQFKPTQGLRVRRGTLVALLVLVGCGIYTLVRRETLGPGAWAVPLWATGYYLHFLFHANFTAPVLILLILGWISWRIVNWPVFADFLIATEAEMNKVSWTTRRRLVQDTIVVLVTVFLMAMFLFVVDVAWIKVLSSWPIRVLQVDLQAERAKQNAPQQW